ncbi:hypothetical protein BX666DRAFT_1950780 [Dichotomocladium elegans]|nr:hypothetical protein BX666DRAFT_1950780 [Dichotomocladium elegans]
MLSLLDQLKNYTTVVADTGDFQTIQQYKAQDATTNPSLIFAATQMPQYAKLIDEAVKLAKERSSDRTEQLEWAMDILLVLFGCATLKVVPGRVSTEADAFMSFSKDGTIEKARRLIALYEEFGISKDRVLIKIGATWEGIQAAKVLEKEYGIHCNLTIMFTFAQAVACAEAGVTLISPFVNRLTAWYENSTGQSYVIEEQPGVMFVKKIYNYYKQQGYKTIIMCASLNTKEEVVELAGCDYMTIPPHLLDELQKDTSTEVTPNLTVEAAVTKEEKIPKLSYLDDEAGFRWSINEDQQASENIGAVIRTFAKDVTRLKDMLNEKL